MIFKSVAILTVCALVASPLGAAEQVASPRDASGSPRRLVTAQPPAQDGAISQVFVDPGADPVPATTDELVRLLRQRVRYVFVLFNENESFDHEYGTFPGANGLYSDGLKPRAPDETPGFTQSYVDHDGRSHRVHPFRLGLDQNSTVTDSVDHSHLGLAGKLAVVDGRPTMSGFAQVEYNGKNANLRDKRSDQRGKQFANVVMSHIDCETIPLQWFYASRFVLFDNIFATEDTPSTPNAVAMISGQGGETSWVRDTLAGRPAQPFRSFPLLGDPVPFWGSPLDPTRTDRQPVSPKESYVPRNIAPNLTFATVLLTAAGKNVVRDLAGDRHPQSNQADIAQDIPAIAAFGNDEVYWGWYQNGYDLEPTDTSGVASHANYVAHHQGPQYFGYLADNSNEIPHLHGEGDFFADVEHDRLPENGGLFYIRGGFGNLQGLKSPVSNRGFPDQAAARGGLTATDVATIQAAKAGDDDHPGYSDRAITEAMNARVINAIASKPKLWAQSAIIITYDESDGFYDHVPPRILSWGPDGLPLSRGIRVPLTVISPFARAHVVSHAEGDHNAVIETINAIFHLPALSGLPDEAAALKAGNAATFNRFGPPGFEQRSLGPRDTPSAISESLLSAFEPKRLRGDIPSLPPSYAMIPDAVIAAIPHYGRNGCKAIGVTPEDARQGLVSVPPANFNSLPATLPGYNSPAPE